MRFSKASKEFLQGRNGGNLKYQDKNSIVLKNLSLKNMVSKLLLAVIVSNVLKS